MELTTFVSDEPTTEFSDMRMNRYTYFSCGYPTFDCGGLLQSLLGCLGTDNFKRRTTSLPSVIPPYLSSSYPSSSSSFSSSSFSSSSSSPSSRFRPTNHYPFVPRAHSDLGTLRDYSFEIR